MEIELNHIEKQVILYAKGHFGSYDYMNDLKYFAAGYYGLEVDQVRLDSLIHLVSILYEKLVKLKYINFNFVYFMDRTMRRGSLFNEVQKIGWEEILKTMLSDICNTKVKGLELGKADPSVFPITEQAGNRWIDVESKVREET